jgi:ubiquinone/menaquinone biosynthesis C-methylase UbiE
MIDLLIVLQAHAKNNTNHKDSSRYVDASKVEISKRSFLSLVDSIQYCIDNKQAPINIKLIVLDDRSESEFVSLVLEKSISQNFTIEFINSKTPGLMENIFRQYEIGKERGKDLVYFAQDDYLYFDSAIWELVDSYYRFANLTQMEVCLFPYDDPYRYGNQYLKYPTKVVLGSKRHWKTAHHTASCFLTNHKTIVENWDLFEAMGNSKYDETCEDRSINRLFQNIEGYPIREIKHVLFTPIPSLALHLQDTSTEDPYLNWKKLWEKYNIPKYFKLPKEKVVVNLGSGTTKLSSMNYTEDLVDYAEISVDLDPKSSPDICADMRDLSVIKSSTIDCIYSSHSLEHVAFHDVRTCLLEWFRVIKPGGEVRIIVPNLKKIFEFVQNGNILDKVYDSECGPICAIDMIYGYRKFIYHGNDFMQHKTGFTKESAEAILASLGFTQFTVFELDTDLMIRLFKPLG